MPVLSELRRFHSLQKECSDIGVSDKLESLYFEEVTFILSEIRKWLRGSKLFRKLSLDVNR